MKKMLLLTALLGPLSVVNAQSKTSAKVEHYKQSTIAFLKKQKIAYPKVPYITAGFLDSLEKANPTKKKINPPKSQAKIVPKLMKGIHLRADQWSGYIYGVTYSDDSSTVSYYTSCLVNPPIGPFTCKASDITMTESGICRGFTQYYAVINE